MLALPKIDQQKASGVHLVIKCLVRARCHRDQARKNNLEKAMIMLKESFRLVGWLGGESTLFDALSFSLVLLAIQTL